MCGIAGFVYRHAKQPGSPEVISAMTDSMTLRGPDARGVHCFSGGAFGARRLSVLDILSGSQPMNTTSCKSVVVVNGEIYNYLELKTQHLLGVSMQSSGDTAVLAELLEKFGADAVSLLNGMFAFAFLDRLNKTLILARDPVGQKPLFYHLNSNLVVFGSTLESVALHPGVELDLDHEAIKEYLVFESFQAPSTPFLNIRKLRPGHLATLDLTTWEWTETRYWTNEINCDSTITLTDAVRNFSTVLQSSVQRCLRSDVSAGIFLSGGLDSNAIVKTACQIREPSTLLTFSMRHTRASYNEADLGQLSAVIFGTRHVEATLEIEQFLGDLPALLSALDEPIADPGFMAIAQLAKFSKPYATVILSGNGGDEFFAGYTPFKALQAARFLRNIIGRTLTSKLGGFESLFKPSFDYMNISFKARHFLRGLRAVRNSDTFPGWLCAFLPDEIPGAGTAQSKQDILYRNIRASYESCRQRDDTSLLLNYFQQHYLSDTICAHSDRASMAFSQELRSPFLDTEMMRFANSLPSKLKYQSGTTKLLLREFLKPSCPEVIVNGTKRGFTVPIGLWLKGPLSTWARDTLNNSWFEANLEFEHSFVNQLVYDHMVRGINRSKPLWTMLVFQNWLQSALPRIQQTRGRLKHSET